jgi:hypothetical protein
MKAASGRGIGSRHGEEPDPTSSHEHQGRDADADDWSTMFHLPGVPAAASRAASFFPIAKRIFKTLVTPTVACVLRGRRVHRGCSAREPTSSSIRAGFSQPGLRLPRACTWQGDAGCRSRGWDARWQKVAKEVGKSMAWSVPTVAGAGDPPPTPGWAV